MENAYIVYMSYSMKYELVILYVTDMCFNGTEQATYNSAQIKR